MTHEEMVIIANGKAVTQTNLMAPVFGKYHRDILGIVRSLLTAENPAVREMFVESTYINAKGRSEPMYIMNRDGFSLLVMRFTGAKALKFQIEFIEAFNAMEQKIKTLSSGMPDFTNPLKAAEAWIEQYKLTEAATAEVKKVFEVVEGLKPHAQIGVNFAVKEGSVSVGTFAPTVGMGQNQLYKRLREDGILISQGERYNEPYAQYREWFDVKPGQIDEGPKKGMVYYKTKITVAGQMALIRKYGRPLTPNVYGKQIQIGRS
jgi:anti-repressor protein